VISAITVGATAYLLKDAFPTDIAATVRELVAGHSPISASIARFIVRRTQNNPEPPPGPSRRTWIWSPQPTRQLHGTSPRAVTSHGDGGVGRSTETGS
jgi:DNA-binding NarL/FixJ family response regulator